MRSEHRPIPKSVPLKRHAVLRTRSCRRAKSTPPHPRWRALGHDPCLHFIGSTAVPTLPRFNEFSATNKSVTTICHEHPQNDCAVHLADASIVRSTPIQWGLDSTDGLGEQSQGLTGRGRAAYHWQQNFKGVVRPLRYQAVVYNKTWSMIFASSAFLNGLLITKEAPKNSALVVRSFKPSLREG